MNSFFEWFRKKKDPDLVESWKKLFDESAGNVARRGEREVEYFFGKPVTDDEISNVEEALGLRLPNELRELLKEFNGIEVKQEYWGPNPLPLYLSTQNMLVDIPKYIQESGNPMPPIDQLGSVVFFAHQNGFAELYAVCVKSFDDFQLGQVLCLDHETGEFELERNSLKHFVECSDYCSL